MGKKFNLEKALMNPSDVFKGPNDVLENDSMNDREKLTILKLWAHDIELLELADEENMCGDEDCTVLLTQIHNAIIKLKENMKNLAKRP